MDDRELSVNTEVCEGYSVCIGIDDEMFELDEVEDFVHVRTQPDSPDSYARAEAAVRQCPKRALTLTQR